MSIHDLNPQSTAPAPTPVAAGLPAGTETLRTSIFLPPMLPGMDQGPQLPPALSAAPSAFTLMRAFQRRWPLAVGAGLVAALSSALIVCFAVPAKYTTSYYVKINSAKLPNAIGDRAEDPDFNIFKLTQKALAKSRPVITRALNSEDNGRFVKDLGIIRESSDAIEWLQGAIKPVFMEAQEIMITSLSADNPEELTLLLNSLAKSLIVENKLIEDKKNKDRIEETQRNTDILQAEIERERREFDSKVPTQAPNVADKGKRLERLNEDFSHAKKAWLDKQNEISTLRSKLEQTVRRAQNPDRVPDSFIDEALSKDPVGLTLANNIVIAHTNYNSALRILQNDARHPEMASYERKKSDAERALADYRREKLPTLTKRWQEKEAYEASGDERKYRIELAALEPLEISLKARVDAAESEIGRLRNLDLPSNLVTLKNRIESNEQTLKKATDAIQSMRLNVPTIRVSILQDAIEPHAKDYGRQTKIAGAGSLGMFLVTVLGVSFIEFRSRKITSTDEVKRGLGLNVIGTVPTLPDKARSPMAQTKLDPYWQNQLMESVDTIRTMLLHSARSNNTRVIMVTSAVGGEGKTSLSTQLAASLARAWKKTLLVDGDLRNPAAHKLFDVAQEPGFSEVLRGELSASEAVRSTPLSRLWVLPAGHWDSHAVQALAQDNVRTMLEELKQQYDFIILDSCPILPVADSLLLGQNVDGVLMTVMREVSRSPAVYAAQQRLESLGIKMLGAVVIGAKNELGPLGYKYAYQARP